MSEVNILFFIIILKCFYQKNLLMQHNSLNGNKTQMTKIIHEIFLCKMNIEYIVSYKVMLP